MTVLNMSKVEMFRAGLHERLDAAAEEIFGLFERAIAEYEEELSRSKRENERQNKLLDAVLKPEVRLHREVLSAGVQQDPKPPYINEEWEQLCSSQEGEQLQEPAPGEKTLFSQLLQTQTEHIREMEPPTSSSAQHMDPENDGEACGVSEPTRRLDPDCRQPVNDDKTPDSFKQADNIDWKQSRKPPSDLTVNLKQRRVSVRLPASDRTSDSSESENGNSDHDWKETRKPQSDLKTLSSSGVPEGDKKCDAGKKSFSCSECGKTFEVCVQSHTKSPSGEKPFICSVCVQRSAHLVTRKRSRSGKKSYTCLICKKQFSSKGDAVRHMRTHTGEKPFGCSVCGKRFTQSTGLGTHMRTHTGEKPFRCSVCPKRFIRSGILARHMRVHTGEKPYSCSVCNASFTLSQSLLKHMRIHTGEKPFSCSVCDKRFTQKGHLTQHMTLHTGERSFSCRVCGRKFSRRSRVKKHKCVTEKSSRK